MICPPQIMKLTKTNAFIKQISYNMYLCLIWTFVEGEEMNGQNKYLQIESEIVEWIAHQGPSPTTVYAMLTLFGLLLISLS